MTTTSVSFPSPTSAVPVEPIDEPQGDDQRWLADFSCFIRSHATFVLAELDQDQALLNEVAPEVLVWRKSQFTSVADLVRECESHRFGGLVYEAWVWETGNRVHALVNRLDPIPAAALIHHAKHLDYYDIDPAAMEEALDEARRALYGEGPYI